MTLGEYLREVRKSNNFSLKDLEKITGISFSQLSKIERGVHNPTEETLTKIAQALNIEDSPFLFQHGNDNSLKNLRMNSDLRYKVLLRDSFSCQLCGAKAPQTRIEVSRIIPHHLGGQIELSNLITLCHNCNMGREIYLQQDGLENDYLYKNIISKNK